MGLDTQAVAELLRFGLAHAMACDAVHQALGLAAAAFVGGGGRWAVGPGRRAPGSPFLAALRALAQAEGEDLGPVVLAQQARVALGDEVGECLGAQQVLVLIGERPGLSSPDSLGLYPTWQPHVGRHDAERNCISNARLEGLPFEAAAQRCWWLVNEARRLRLTGVGLKDRSGEARLPGPAAAP
jgi:ethanolamine ammonia-lyase small subunit